MPFDYKVCGVPPGDWNTWHPKSGEKFRVSTAGGCRRCSVIIDAIEAFDPEWLKGHLSQLIGVYDGEKGLCFLTGKPNTSTILEVVLRQGRLKSKPFYMSSMFHKMQAPFKILWHYVYLYEGHIYFDLLWLVRSCSRMITDTADSKI
jgi:hypothetical protein